MIATDLAGGGEIGIRLPGDDGGGLNLRNLWITRRSRKSIVSLEQEPLLLRLSRSWPHAYEMPTALEALAVEFEVKVPFGVALARIGQRRPPPLIPDDHGPA